MSYRLLFKNLKIRICGTIIRSVLSCGFETWSVVLREDNKLRWFYDRLLKKRESRWMVSARRNEEIIYAEHYNWFTSPACNWVNTCRWRACGKYEAEYLRKWGLVEEKWGERSTKNNGGGKIKQISKT